MAQSVTLYNLLISCPGDVRDEVTLIEAAVDEFNELYADPLGITIKTRHWSKSSYAQSGRKPQALLNEQFVNKCDAAVAIFWTKFGSPTDEYGSGTEEEIEIMRLVGASNVNIKLPFIFEGLFLGLIGSVIPVLATTYGYVALYKNFNGQAFNSPFIKLIIPEPFIYYVSFILIGIGVFVGMIGSARAVRKYLKI